MSTTFVENVTLTVINCGECGATYAINERFAKNAPRGEKLDLPLL